MAKDRTPAPETEDGKAAAPATAAVSANDERFKTVTDPETGLVVKRSDYIRKCWEVKKMSRGAIAKHLSELTGKKVIYQTVFAVIKKGHPGGPDKPAEVPAAAA